MLTIEVLKRTQKSCRLSRQEFMADDTDRFVDSPVDT